MECYNFKMEQESLNKTWFIDIDGTIVKSRNNEQLDEAVDLMGSESYLSETPIKKSLEFIQSIPVNDTIVLTTARDSRHEEHTLRMLNHFNIRYDKILFDLRAGARILINDIKPDERYRLVERHWAYLLGFGLPYTIIIKSTGSNFSISCARVFSLFP